MLHLITHMEKDGSSCVKAETSYSEFTPLHTWITPAEIGHNGQMFF